MGEGAEGVEGAAEGGCGEGRPVALRPDLALAREAQLRHAPPHQGLLSEPLHLFVAIESRRVRALALSHYASRRIWGVSLSPSRNVFRRFELLV